VFIRESDIRPSNHENLVRTLCALAIQADFRRSLSTDRPTICIYGAVPLHNGICTIFEPVERR